MTTNRASGNGKPELSWFHRHFEAVNRITGFLAAIGFLAIIAVVFVGPRGLNTTYITQHFWDLLSYMPVGLTVTAIAFAVGIPIGFFVGWIRVSAAGAKPPPFQRHRTPEEKATFRALPWKVRTRIQSQWILWFLKQGASRVLYGYIELMRGTPIFVQIFFIWSVILFRFPSLGTANIAFVAGVFALTMNTGAYQGEIFRGGLQAVQQGQIEAARAVGLRYWGTMRHITLPQALRLILPPLTNEFIGLLKASALLYTVGLHETTAEGYFLTVASLRVFEVFFMVTICYLLITLPLAWAVKYMERRLRIPGLGISAEAEQSGRGKAPSRSVRESAVRSAFSSDDIRRMFLGTRRARGEKRGADPLGNGVSLE